MLAIQCSYYEIFDHVTTFWKAKTMLTFTFKTNYKQHALVFFILKVNL